MKIKLGKTLAFMCTMVLMFLASGCGEPIPQNKLALIVQTMGDRDKTESSIVWGARLPTGTSINPAVRVYKFPLGLQDYEFSERPSYESPNDNAIRVDSLGGQLSFDVNVQCYIERNTTNLNVKLLQFVNDHMLRSYSGDNNLLSVWAGEKLHQILREPIAQYTLGKQAIDTMRVKAEVNHLLMEKMNQRFNKYGIVFCSIGITSAIHLPDAQKQKMNQIVLTEYTNQVLRLRDEKYMPLVNKLAQVEQIGMGLVQDEKNRGETHSIAILAQAQQDRRETFKTLVGDVNYINLEKMLLLTKGLDQSPTKILLIPSNVQYIGGPNMPGVSVK